MGSLSSKRLDTVGAPRAVWEVSAGDVVGNLIARGRLWGLETPLLLCVFFVPGGLDNLILDPGVFSRDNLILAVVIARFRRPAADTFACISGRFSGLTGIAWAVVLLAMGPACPKAREP